MKRIIYPLCVDLDGTLLKSDLLFETLISFIKKNFFTFPFKLFFWVLHGKAFLKYKLAENSSVNILNLPYNEELIQWLKDEKNNNNRYLVLVTAANKKLAQKIFDNFIFFDQLIASDITSNYSGKQKANILINFFGAKGFDYVGNSWVDLNVWKFSRNAIVVDPPFFLINKIKGILKIKKIFYSSENTIFSWFRALRFHQWSKNILLFFPLLAAHKFLDLSDLPILLCAFLSMSLCASAVYLINDLLDIENDRLHPNKRNRPLASGSLSIGNVLISIPFLLILSFSLSSYINPYFVYALALYFCISSLYSLKLKQLVLIDCITLAALYTLRIVIGSIAFNLNLSPWLLAFSWFLFLSLSFLKRFAEFKTHLAHNKQDIVGRGYLIKDEPLIAMFGISSGFVSVLILALYLNSEIATKLYTSPLWVWVCIPILIFWLNWMWLVAHRGRMHDDPLFFALKDKISIFSGLFFSIFLLLGSLF
jgi:4-hydroxybenzoate polyprenyltransferase